MSTELYLKLRELIEQTEDELLTLQDGSVKKKRTLRRLELLEDRIEALPPEILSQFSHSDFDDSNDDDSDATDTLDVDPEIFNEVEASAKLNELSHSFDAEINREIDLLLQGKKAHAGIMFVNVKSAKTDASTKIKYAPVQKPVKGQYELGCIGIVWSNGKKPKGSISSMGNAVAKTTRELSGGLATFKVTAKSIRVPYMPARKNLNKAEDYVKRALNKSAGHSFDIYDIVNSNVKKYSNAGGDTAHLQGTLIRTALHETYHLRPFKQGHAGRILPNGKLDAYGDNLSFMGRFPTNRLNAPELWNLGWPDAPNKTAQYDIGDPATQYKMEQLFFRKPSENITGVLIPRKVGRPMFLALYTTKEKGAKKSEAQFGLHYFTTGPSGGIGTQRIKMFKDHVSYDGVTIKKVSTGTNYSTIEVSTDPVPPSMSIDAVNSRRSTTRS